MTITCARIEFTLNLNRLKAGQSAKIESRFNEVFQLQSRGLLFVNFTREARVVILALPRDQLRPTESMC
jgi:hypothetical protein